MIEEYEKRLYFNNLYNEMDDQGDAVLRSILVGFMKYVKT